VTESITDTLFVFVPRNGSLLLTADGAQQIAESDNRLQAIHRFKKMSPVDVSILLIGAALIARHIRSNERGSMHPEYMRC
jgi:hypothetical protein